MAPEAATELYSPAMSQRVQIYSPHPDDVEIFVGGTMLRHYHEHDPIEVVMATRGEGGTVNPWIKRRGTLPAIRTREAEARFARLPGVRLRWLDWPDGGVRQSEETVGQVAELIAAGEPDLVYLPDHPKGRSFYDHPDHAETARIVEAAVARTGRRLRLRHYHTNRPNLLVDVTAFEVANAAALRLYATQYALLANPPLLLWRRELVRWLMLRRWSDWKNNPRIHGTINNKSSVCNLPVAPGTEAFREQ